MSNSLRAGRSECLVIGFKISQIFSMTFFDYNAFLYLFKTETLVFRIQRHPKHRPVHSQVHHQVLGYICLKPLRMAVELLRMTSSIIFINF